MKRVWQARPGRYGLLAFTLLVFTACLLFSFHRIKQQHEVQLRDVDRFQLALEGLRMGRLDRFDEEPEPSLLVPASNDD